jgi:hypothetical protein
MMDKNDILVLAGIITGTSVIVSLMFLLQNGIIDNPFVKI